MHHGDPDAGKTNMSGAPFNIILVEDAEPDVLLVREALEQSGLDFELQVFDDGEQGVDFVESMDRDATLERPAPVSAGPEPSQEDRRSDSGAGEAEPPLRAGSGGYSDVLGFQKGQGAGRAIRMPPDISVNRPGWTIL